MRRSNKPFSSGIKSKQGLDLPSYVHDIDDGSKIHKPKRTPKSNIAIYLAIALISLGTLFYMARKVHSAKQSFLTMPNGKLMVGRGKEATDPSSSSFSRQERFLAQQNRLLPPDSIYRAKVKDIHGDWQQLMQYSGSVSLVVNVACEWGLTKSNYKELAVLSDRYASRGFKVLAFPSNDFHQETGTDEEILNYVLAHFPQVNFPLFSKSPLQSNMVFQLAQKHTGEGVEWNFHKYLVDGQGHAVKSYGHRVQPYEIEEDIVSLLESNDVKKMQVPQTF